jgi:hypothetical protein
VTSVPDSGTTAPQRPAADLTVGSAPCTYATIASAMLARQSRDRCCLEGGWSSRPT